MDKKKKLIHSKLFLKLLRFIYIIFQFIRKILILDKNQILLLCAQDGDIKDQLKLAKLFYVKGNYVTAFAWAETASFQGNNEARTLKDEIWAAIPSEQKVEAQNLARKFRMDYTRK